MGNVISNSQITITSPHSSSTSIPQTLCGHTKSSAESTRQVPRKLNEQQVPKSENRRAKNCSDLPDTAKEQSTHEPGCAPWEPWPRELFMPAMPDRLKVVQFEEIREATDNFNEKQALGKGLSGVVYEGCWHGNQVAVKNLYEDIDSMSRMDFLHEITVLSTIAHVNVVKLIGVSVSRTSGERALICELMDGGNLEDRLFPSCSTWKEDSYFPGHERLQILSDACIGLGCLHSCEMVHCDIKPANILLRRNGQAAIGDFGLSKPRSMGKSGYNIGRRMAGTKGYLDPFWKHEESYTASSDIYAMGIVILQVLMGEASLDKKGDTLPKRFQHALFQSGHSTAEWIADSGAEWAPRVAQTLAEVGMQACQFERSQRPTIGQVLASLAMVSTRTDSMEASGLVSSAKDEFSRMSTPPQRFHGDDNKPVINSLQHQWGVCVRHNLSKMSDPEPMVMSGSDSSQGSLLDEDNTAASMFWNPPRANPKRLMERRSGLSGVFMHPAMHALLTSEDEIPHKLLTGVEGQNPSVASEVKGSMMRPVSTSSCVFPAISLAACMKTPGSDSCAVKTPNGTKIAQSAVSTANGLEHAS